MGADEAKQRLKAYAAWKTGNHSLMLPHKKPTKVRSYLQKMGDSDVIIPDIFSLCTVQHNSHNLQCIGISHNHGFLTSGTPIFSRYGLNKFVKLELSRLPFFCYHVTIVGNGLEYVLKRKSKPMLKGSLYGL